MSIFNRRQTGRTGRSAPANTPSRIAPLEQPKIPVEDLYRLDLPDPTSPIVPTFLTYPSHLSPDSAPRVVDSVKPSSPPVLAPTAPALASGITFPRFPAGSIAYPVSQRSRIAPTPPPQYMEHYPVHDENACPAIPSAGSARSRTSSASSWIKRVVSRSSSRASLRKHYEQLPPSDEERVEAERLKAQKAQEALNEWNRINDALKAAGF